MEEAIMLGAPSFGEVLNLTPEKEFFVPFGQGKICHDIVKETQDKAIIIERLATEYLSIILALKEMNVNFYITYTEGVLISTEILKEFKGNLKCKLLILPKKFPPQFGCYPRDMLTILPKSKIVLVNQEISRKRIGQRGEYYFLSSQYGEGGRVLSCDDTVLVAKRLIIGNTKRRCDDQLMFLRQKGVRVCQLPLPLAGVCTLNKIEEKLLSNDHLDRVSNLIKGKDGALHLIVDPKICIIDEDKKGDWIPLGPKESIKKIIEQSELLGIKVHYPNKMEIPYSINFEQFTDGRILMSSGDEPLAKILEGIVGHENVFQTKVPIRFTPVYNRSGIRCMLNEIPEPMIKTLLL